MTARYPNELEDCQQAWHDIEAAMAEIASLASSELPFQQLAAELLERTVQMLAARGGAVWLVDSGAGLQLQAQLGLKSIQSCSEPRLREFHESLLQEAILQKQPRLVLPGNAISDSGSALNPTDDLWMVHPLVIDGEVVGLLELLQRPTTDSDSLRGHRRLLAIVGEVAVDYLKRGHIRELRRSQARSEHFGDFAYEIHRSLNLHKAAYALANDGRVYIDCDRVSIVIRSRRKYQLLAISGVDALNRRSNDVKKLEALALAVAQMREPLWYDGDAKEVPPQIERQLDAYIDVVHCRTIALVPLIVPDSDQAHDAARTVGVLVVEEFERVTDVAWRERIMSLARHGTLALKNALDYHRLPTLPFARNWSGGRYSLRRGFVGLIITAAVVLGIATALLTVPADFDVGARGEIQPLDRHDIYAPLNGEIVELRVAHNAPVSTGDVLLVLNSTEIDLQLGEARGERDTTKKRLLSVESALIQSEIGRDAKRLDRERMAAEHEELKLQFRSQQRQIDLLNQERQKLTVRSPIDGRVLTWNVDQLLENRPVQRGQVLLSVADPRGDWIAELQVPDHHIGFVLDAQQEQEVPLKVSFELATTPGVVHEGVITKVASRVELDGDHRSTVRVTVDVHPDQAVQLRPGATILARIRCGQKPLGFAWFHDLIGSVREWMWL